MILGRVVLASLHGVRILRARPEHIPAVLDLAGRLALNSRPGDSGFLVSNFTEDDYRALLGKAEYFYVAVKDDALLGFVIAYTDQRVGPDEEAGVQIRRRLQDFVLIKQVAVEPAQAGGGIGTALYEHVLKRCEGIPAVAAVVDSPPNIASANFHRKNGFERFLEFTPADGLSRVVWRRQQVDLEVLSHQYGVALELYRHEDLLNWQKLNNFLYVMVGQFAVMGLIIKPVVDSSKKSDSSVTALAEIMASVGLITSLGFTVAIASGIYYLQSRKRSVADIERSLLRFGGSRIVNTSVAESKWLRKSPTTYFLWGLPLISAVAWLAAGVFVALA